MSEAKEKLKMSNAAIAFSVGMLRPELPTIELFLKECRDMDNFGHIVDPTLFMNSERRVVSSAVKPIYEAARDFVRAYDEHTAKLKAAAAKVGVDLGKRA